ncbi:hypothetical protein D9753_06170 [Streptomyces dangxiongensis]|uniref:Uncharacterized protein n=1 Tax=Streptomyces dangxiongensis TaxID=1442032 RepID=A0A3G2J8I5_9ACTN|nr:hypothetical protein D9753_06170 [Streptomyces dangxiongensis]
METAPGAPRPSGPHANADPVPRLAFPPVLVTSGSQAVHGKPVRDPLRSLSSPGRSRRTAAQPRSLPSAATAAFAALMAPLLISSVAGAFLVSKSLPL